MTVGLEPALRSDLKKPYAATVNASGVVEIDITPTRSWSWLVTQVSVKLAGAPVGTTAEMLVNGSFVTKLVATGGVASGTPSVLLDPGDTLTVRWTGATPGQTATATVFYDEKATR